MRVSTLCLPLLLSLAALAACRAQDSTTPAAAAQVPQAEASPDRLAWFREARFGLFLHWGLYAIPAGEWGEGRDHGEWIRTTAQIPLERYAQFQAQWNPTAFDADAWAELAKQAGMGYVVITTKHHDGFCLFDSAYTDWDVGNTPFGRDVMAELSAACARQGLVMGWYHSIMDWHHPDYLPRRDWEVRDSSGADFERYLSYLRSQVTELLTRYGPIGVMWFDGEWENTWTHEQGQALYDLCRELQPQVVVNNRVDKGRSGMQGMTLPGRFAGDYGTPEQEVPARGFPGIDWETCMTMNDHWGYNAVDQHWKSSAELVKTLVDVASKGGNFLLNVGPTADGRFPEASIERLRAIGQWMAVNGEAIHGTRATPLGALPFGRCTWKPMGQDSRLFLHVFDWPADGRLRLDGLGNAVVHAELLGGSHASLELIRGPTTLQVVLPAEQPAAQGAPVWVVALDLRGEPVVYDAPRIEAPGTEFVLPMLVKLSVDSAGLELRYTLDGSPPGPFSALYVEPILIEKSCTLSAQSFYQGQAVSAPTEQRLRRVFGRVAALRDTSRLTPGCRLRLYPGSFERVPDFGSSAAASEEYVTELGLPAGPAQEQLARAFEGWLQIEVEDVYDFSLTSDDGARLWIGDKLLIDNDGLHSPLEKRGRIPLGVGLHALRVEHFNAGGGAELDLLYGQSGQPLQPIDANHLWR